MSKHHKKGKSIKKKTTAVIYLAVVLTPQAAQYAQIAQAKPYIAPVKQITLPSDQKVNLNLDNSYNYKAKEYNGNVIKVTTDSGNTLSIEPLKEGSTFLTVELSDSVNTIVQSFVINIVDTGTDGILDVGDIVNHLRMFPSSAVVSDVTKMLEGIESRVFATSHTYVSNLSPVALSQPMIIFDAKEEAFVQSFSELNSMFTDLNGDYLSYSIVQGPDPLSGLSLSLNGGYLSIGGTPTAPTAFTVRATDPSGLYADMESTLNFVPEPVSHAVIQTTGSLTQIDLNEYFIDRDHEALSFGLNGYSYTSNAVSTWLDGHVLTISGTIVTPMSLHISATDGHGWWAYNTAAVQGENLAPLALSQPMVVYHPQYGEFVRSFTQLDELFRDPNGDWLSYSIVQNPDPQSGLSLSLNGGYLSIGGTPTAPTAFTVRATDPSGLYADMQSTLNFVPEAVSHAVIQSTGSLTQIDLNEYFIDRDHEALSFGLNGYSYTSNAVSTWLDGHVLTISGTIVTPMSLHISATDGHGWWAYNTAAVQGENLAPQALSQPMVIYHPQYGEFVRSFAQLDELFRDPNGDYLSYSIVQNPDPQSGLSLSLNGGYLSIGGTPTAPTAFTVRATDPSGLYADMESTLNFVPEPVSHAVIQTTGSLTQIDLNEYFIDRDHEALSFGLNGYSYTSNAVSTWLDGHVLTISGTIVTPMSLHISATDGHGWWAYNTAAVQGENLAPQALSQPMVIYHPQYGEFVRSFAQLDELFRDPNGDYLSYSIVQNPDPQSGLSLSLNGGYLSIGGTPTAPTAFTVRATDPSGLYADMQSTLNFVPEAVSHAVIQSTGSLTQIDLNEYFIDRDHEALSFGLNGYSYTSNAVSTWLDGHVLTISGTIVTPMSLHISATDGHGWWAYNTAAVQGENLAPLALSQPMVVYHPQYGEFVRSFTQLDELFRDPNGDYLSYSIVQNPDPQSGLSLSLNGGYLSIGGTPTAPTAFTVRATDPSGLYADMQSTLNFVPEAVSHAVIQSTGSLTQIDLNEYFIDRDHESLSFGLNGYSYTSNAVSTWLDGHVLTISGAIVTPMSLHISATDGHGWWAYNTAAVQGIPVEEGDNLAPLTLSQPIVIYNATDDYFMQPFFNLDELFRDPNGDWLSYSIVQNPDPQSGLSLSLNGGYLSIGGTPTAPTAFTVRATDPSGLYADMQSTLNFVPEAVSHAVIQANGPLTQIDLNEYFIDRDYEALSFGLNGYSGTSYPVSTWLDGKVLFISGVIASPMSIQISATDGHGWWVNNSIRIDKDGTSQ